MQVPKAVWSASFSCGDSAMAVGAQVIRATARRPITMAVRMWFTYPCGQEPFYDLAKIANAGLCKISVPRGRLAAQYVADITATEFMPPSMVLRLVTYRILCVRRRHDAKNALHGGANAVRLEGRIGTYPVAQVLHWMGLGDRFYTTDGAGNHPRNVEACTCTTFPEPHLRSVPDPRSDNSLEAIMECVE